MLVKFRKIEKEAVIPSKANPGDAGMDLTATRIVSETDTQITYGTSLAMELPKNAVGLIFPRSSVRKYDLALSNSVGVIDSGYRGEIQFTFNKTSTTKNDKFYEVGDRIGQLVISELPKVIVEVSEELTETERGDGGFGSTGS